MPLTIFIKEISYKHSNVQENFHFGPVNLQIQSDLFTFWIGHNGSGKTTLARILSGEVSADSGQVIGLNGSAMHYSQSIGSNVFSDLTIYEHFRLLNVLHSQVYQNFQIVFPEIIDIQNKYPDELSGGQLQLAAFATVVLKKYSLYIFDEILNHLDAHMSARVIQWIKMHIITEQHIPCIVITHDLNCVQNHADIVHVFSEGKMIKSIYKDELSKETTQIYKFISLKPEGS